MAYPNQKPTWEGSLLEFQQELDRAVEAPDISTDAFLAMRVGEGMWLIDLGYLSETSVPPPLSRTGRSPAWVLGIGSLRGQVYTMVDMQRVLLDKPTVSVHHGWATPVHGRISNALALIWPEMVGLVRKKQLSPHPMDKELGPWVRQCWKDEQQNVWQEFDMEAFVRSSFVNLETQVHVNHE